MGGRAGGGVGGGGGDLWGESSLQRAGGVIPPTPNTPTHPAIPPPPPPTHAHPSERGPAPAGGGGLVAERAVHPAGRGARRGVRARAGGEGAPGVWHAGWVWCVAWWVGVEGGWVGGWVGVRVLPEFGMTGGCGVWCGGWVWAAGGMGGLRARARARMLAHRTRHHTPRAAPPRPPPPGHTLSWGSGYPGLLADCCDREGEPTGEKVCAAWGGPGWVGGWVGGWEAGLRRA